MFLYCHFLSTFYFYYSLLSNVVLEIPICIPFFDINLTMHQTKTILLILEVSSDSSIPLP